MNYLWVPNRAAAKYLYPQQVSDRFQVLAPQIWQDLYPDRDLPMPDPLPEAISPYLRLFPQRLHVPEVYGLLPANGEEWLLLGNVPIDRQGNFYPMLNEMWAQASVTRQLYWLWQILNLWTPLSKEGVASSLLIPENLRVEGWRVRLRQLFSDRAAREGFESARSSAGGVAVIGTSSRVSLAALGESWEPLASSARPEIASLLSEIIAGLKIEGVPFDSIADALNELLLARAAKQPLRVRVAGASDRGRIPSHNEDSYYPTSADLGIDGKNVPERLTSHLLVICDGIGGHEGGEVASHIAVQSIRLQARSLLAELDEDPKVMTPGLVEDQIAATIRIANNAIAARNDQQKREARQRMATTLVMALQLPQKIARFDGEPANGHELYIAHVGDSRAYWITPNYCQQLTVDDDIASREVRRGRKLYRESLALPGSEALTQALGTRSGESLRPTLQRFIIEEDGVLLLCSDGMSDGDVLEEAWQTYLPPVIRGQISLESAVESLIRRANEKNGRDNISVVAAHYSVAAQPPVLVNLAELPKTEASEPIQVGIEAPPEPPEPEEKEAEIEPILTPDLEIEEELTSDKSPAYLEELRWGIKGLLLALLIGVLVLLMRWSIDSQDKPQPSPTAPVPETTN